MEIKELIRALEKIQEEYGNIEVQVQYRDDGGTYFGTEDPLLFVDEYRAVDEKGNSKDEKTLIL